jgi:hypothetical protein
MSYAMHIYVQKEMTLFLAPPLRKVEKKFLVIVKNKVFKKKLKCFTWHKGLV